MLVGTTIAQAAFLRRCIARVPQLQTDGGLYPGRA